MVSDLLVVTCLVVKLKDHRLKPGGVRVLLQSARRLPHSKAEARSRMTPLTTIKTKIASKRALAVMTRRTVSTSTRREVFKCTGRTNLLRLRQTRRRAVTIFAI